MLKNQIMLSVSQDVSYKLVKIKGAQVNHNQMTPVRLIDFISVLVLNKRNDIYSDGEVLFGHSHIVEFI